MHNIKEELIELYNLKKELLIYKNKKRNVILHSTIPAKSKDLKKKNLIILSVNPNTKRH